MPFTAYAQQNASKDWGDQFITHAELEDKNGNPKTDFYINDTMKANWDFNIPSNTPIKAGDTMTVKIPSPLQVQGVVEFDIIDSSGKVIWHAKTNPDGTVTITFNEEAQAEAAGGIKGSFNIYTHWDNSKAKTNDVVPIDWGTGGKSTIHIVPSVGPNPTELLTKSGTIDPANPNVINWTVRINFAQQDIKNAVYTDTIGGNQTLVSGTASGRIVSHDPGATNYKPIGNVPTNAITESKTGFTVNLGELKDTVIFYYKTNITNNGQSATYENQGRLTGDNITEQDVDVHTADNGGGGGSETTVYVSGKKAWADIYNSDGIRPATITINLLANGKIIQTQTINPSSADSFNTWLYSFKNLPKNDAKGKQINYTVTENPIPGYTPQYIDNGVDKNGNKVINIVNTHETGQTDVAVTKVWDDASNQDGSRPESIQVQLYRDGNKQGQPVTLNQSNQWQYDWGQLPATQFGNQTPIKYTVEEINVPNGYQSKIETNIDTNQNTKFVITNSHTPIPDTTGVQVAKVWNDSNNQDGIRPTSVQVQLYANGEAQGAPVTLNNDNNWQNIWNKLPQTSNGNVITYTVKEVTTIVGYTATTVQNGNTFVITNTYQPNTPIPINPHDAENPTIPVNPVGPDNSNESENATINSFNDEQNSNGKIDTLPATDQQKATSIIIVRVGLLIITGILFWFVKKRD